MKPKHLYVIIILLVIGFAFLHYKTEEKHTLIKQLEAESSYEWARQSFEYYQMIPEIFRVSGLIKNADEIENYEITPPYDIAGTTGLSGRYYIPVKDIQNATKYLLLMSTSHEGHHYVMYKEGSDLPIDSRTPIIEGVIRN